ncbi:adenylate/guanylate cyclase catalytic domain protein, partial [Oesophagostomum dentatum]
LQVADELLKDASELRRPSASLDSNCRTSNATNVTQQAPAEEQPLKAMNSVPDVRKFRPFTMNLMTDVSILFADIAGFTKMSSNKSADELVNLLNDLFGRFDYLCKMGGLEKISTLGDCYYCVAGCPEPCADHAIRTVEMGLNMIVAIRQFDIDRGQEVNMRVGIHTGKVSRALPS